MDSRIREIEQWIEEAKTGLSDGGREEYVKKLYLLDAEIRAVIKENGILPGATSPSNQVQTVRSFVSPALGYSAAALAVILVAATVYLTNPFAASIQTYPENSEFQLAESSDTPQPEATDSNVFEIGYIPDSISGEEILAADWQPTVIEDQSEPGEVEAILAATRNVRPLPGMPVLDPGSMLGAGVDAPPLLPVPVHGFGVDAARFAVAGGEGSRNSLSPVHTSSGTFCSGVERIISFAYFPEAAKEKDEPKVESNSLKDKLSSTSSNVITVDIVDNSNEQSTEKVDKLDPDALKENVEKHFGK